MSSPLKNETRKLVPKCAIKSLVDSKWIYSIKEGNSVKQPLGFKVRLVAKSSIQNWVLTIMRYFPS